MKSDGAFVAVTVSSYGALGHVPPLHKTIYLFKYQMSKHKKVKVKVKADIGLALHGNPISELRDVTCHM